MSQTAHLVVANNVGCGMSEGRCLPCSGVSGRTAAVYSSSYLSHYRIHSVVKLRGLKYASASASFVCEARRNPDFSRQNKHGSSRSRNKHNEGRDSFENFEEDMLSLKNGPLPSLSASGKSQATAVPGPREKEIVELFRKVQARLRERAATKEQKKVEASPVRGKENGTVDSLLKLLKKHSSGQQKKSSGEGRGNDSRLDGSQETSQHNGGRRSTNISDLGNAAKDEPQVPNISSVSRPQSRFQQRSPVPRVKFQPTSHDEEDTNVAQPSREIRVNNHDHKLLKIDHKEGPDSEPDIDHDLESSSEPHLDHLSDQDSEPVLVPRDELFFPDREIDDLSDDDSEHTDNDEHTEEEEELVVQHEDLSALKLPELRALAKSRGLKGFSKMKKSDLVELLAGS